MRNPLIFSAIATSFLATFLASDSCASVRHDLTVKLDPAAHRLEVRDRLEFAEKVSSLSFDLHGGLSPVVEGEDALLLSKGGCANASVPCERYEVQLSAPRSSLTLKYAGVVFHPLENDDSPGFVDEGGAQLSNATYWYPRIAGDDYVTFKMRVEAPADWKVVSQGDRIASGNSWEILKPQDEIYLIAAPFAEYDRDFPAVKAMAFLRQPDAALASQYLDVTGQTVDFYGKLLGEYAYGKFALVENLAETGYGMPSFTLLGPSVIRLPFILQSSFPHEILHNWWGNGVFVDYEGGNWCEGLTTYLADHLLREREGKGADNRRVSLQDYRDYAASGRDFPLTEFRERHSAATQAVGYGKAMMTFHMLRSRLGDEVFVAGLRRFYAERLFTKASWTDIQRTFEAVSGQDLSAYFDQWVAGVGAPKLVVRRAEPQAAGGRWVVKLDLEQTQTGRVYDLDVPMAIAIEGAEQAVQVKVRMSQKTQHFEIPVPARAVQVVMDPEFDVFRMLSDQEIPPALSRALGAAKPLVVVPAGAASDSVESTLAGLLKGSVLSEAEVVSESAVAQLPADRALFVLGAADGSAGAWVKAGAEASGVQVTASQIRIDGNSFDRAGRSFVLAFRNPRNPAQEIVWIAPTEGAAPAIARKLPHYGRYGYAVFEGADSRNVLRGEWPSTQFRARLAPRLALGQGQNALPAPEGTER